VSAQPAPRCSDASRSAHESLAGTATTTERWLLVEVPGSWPRDVSTEGALPEGAHAALSSWVSATPRSRLLFLRQPGRSAKRARVFAVTSREGSSELRRIVVERHEDLAYVDLDVGGELVDGRLVLVCGHGSRDQCCALRGTPVFIALASRFDADEIWISSHQGGHRFAGNVLVLPAGVHLGRLDPDNAWMAVERVLGGKIDLAHYRGRTFYDAQVQAAEHAIRAATGLDSLDDLRLAAVEDSLVRFQDRDGRAHAAEVEHVPGPIVPASCGAPSEPQALFRARVL
jgi:hypothetical protein